MVVDLGLSATSKEQLGLPFGFFVSSEPFVLLLPAWVVPLDEPAVRVMSFG